MTFWQMMALIFISVFIVAAIALYFEFREALKKENEINEKRFQREQEWHDKEEENWRHVDPALQKRIKELEATCKDNQRVIANLRLELLNKDQFLSTFKLKDLYDQGIWPANK